MLVSVIRQSESAINIYNPSLSSLPLEVVTEHRAELLVPLQQLATGCSRHGRHMWQSHSPSSLPKPPPHAHRSLLHVSPLFLPQNRFIGNVFPDYTIWCRNSTAEHIPWENHNSKRYRHPNIHCSTISNSQDMEAPTHHRQTTREDAVHTQWAIARPLEGTERAIWRDADGHGCFND